jgi:mercuric reductase
VETRHFDLVILGSGSTAFAAAIRSAELGKAAGRNHDPDSHAACRGPSERRGHIVPVVGGATQTLRSSHLMEAVGRAPNTEKLGLDVAGVRTDNCGAVIADEELRTTAPHVWAAGDVIGFNAENQMATPVGAHDGGIAALNALLREHRKADHTVIPRAIFTGPEGR